MFFFVQNCIIRSNKKLILQYSQKEYFFLIVPFCACIITDNKKIFSEGQRKSLFEVSETERKSNADQILQLKKEIARLIVDLHECTNPTAKYRIQNKRIVEIIGPLADKTVAEVSELLDLQVIDSTKRLDLIRHRLKQVLK